MNDQFCRKIRQIPVLRFSDIVEASWPCVPEEYYDCPWKYFHRNEDPNDRGRRPIIDDVGNDLKKPSFILLMTISPSALNAIKCGQNDMLLKNPRSIL